MILIEIDKLIEESMMDTVKEKAVVAGQNIKEFAQKHKNKLIGAGVAVGAAALANKGLHSAGAATLIDKHADVIKAAKSEVSKASENVHKAASAVKKTINFKGSKISYNPTDKVKTLAPGLNLTKQQMADAYYNK